MAFTERELDRAVSDFHSWLTSACYDMGGGEMEAEEIRDDPGTLKDLIGDHISRFTKNNDENEFMMLVALRDEAERNHDTAMVKAIDLIVG